MRAAVIGAGIFGCTTAAELTRAGWTVDLYDRHPDVMCGASRANQGRLHSGYHYPRCPETAMACRKAADEFAQRFPSAVRRYRHHYVIADGKLTPGEYLRFCRDLDLPYVEVKHPLVHNGVTVQVPEALIDLRELRRLLKAELRGTHTHFGRSVDPADLNHDLVVDATYGLSGRRLLRFEVCEVAVVRLGPQFEGKSFVVIDGDFVSLDPRGDLHMLYDVVHSVHHANVGSAPQIPDKYRRLLDHGPVPAAVSNVEAMQMTARRFLAGVGLPEYLGSMFTVRAVLPDVDSTDERPTLVQRDANLISILSGKICTAVPAARQVAEMAR